MNRLEVQCERCLRNSATEGGGDRARPKGNCRPQICRSFTYGRRRLEANGRVFFVLAQRQLGKTWGTDENVPRSSNVTTPTEFKDHCRQWSRQRLWRLAAVLLLIHRSSSSRGGEISFRRRAAARDHTSIAMLELSRKDLLQVTHC